MSNARDHGPTSPGLHCCARVDACPDWPELQVPYNNSTGYLWDAWSTEYRELHWCKCIMPWLLSCAACLSCSGFSGCLEAVMSWYGVLVVVCADPIPLTLAVAVLSLSSSQGARLSSRPFLAVVTLILAGLVPCRTTEKRTSSRS